MVHILLKDQILPLFHKRMKAGAGRTSVTVLILLFAFFLSIHRMTVAASAESFDDCHSSSTKSVQALTSLQELLSKRGGVLQVFH